MPHRRRCAPLVTVLIASVAAAVAAEVRVVDRKGEPVPDARVTCVEGPEETAFAGLDGVAAIGDGCRAVTCEHGTLVADDASVRGGTARCRLEPGVVVAGEFASPGCGGRCEVYLFRSGKRRPAQAENVGAPDGGGPERFRMRPVRPAEYSLMALDRALDWRCSAPLGKLPAGDHVVRVVFRRPVEVRGTVFDGKGRAVAGAEVTARPDPALTARPGYFHCTRGTDLSVKTADDGTFTLRVDRLPPLTLEADWGRGGQRRATATFSEIPDGPVELSAGTR